MMSKDDNPSLSPFASQCLLSAIHEVQNRVRAYDTKAQIVCVGFIFSIGIITGFAERFFTGGLNATPWMIALSWLLAVGPIAMFGMVLYPSRAMSPTIGAETGSLRYTYYFRPMPGYTMDHYLKDVRECDWVAEITYEIMKMSSLRELKRVRFLRALWASGAAYAGIISLQMLRSLNVLDL